MVAKLGHPWFLTRNAIRNLWTTAEDGDTLDVLLLIDEPAFTGCLVRARLLGAIEAAQTSDGRTERNDRLIAVAANRILTRR